MSPPRRHPFPCLRPFRSCCIGILHVQVRVNALRESRILTPSTVDLLAAAGHTSAPTSPRTGKAVGGGGGGAAASVAISARGPHEDARDGRGPRRNRAASAFAATMPTGAASTAWKIENERKPGKLEAVVRTDRAGSEVLGGVGAQGAAAGEAAGTESLAAELVRQRDPLWEYKQQV